MALSPLVDNRQFHKNPHDEFPAVKGGLRSFFSWRAEIGEIPFNATHAIKGATRKDTKKRHNREALTDSAVRRLLKRPNRETAEGIRDYAMLTLMLYTAARAIELHRADLADLQTVNSKLVLYVQGKGHMEKDEMVVITGEAENAMYACMVEYSRQEDWRVVYFYVQQEQRREAVTESMGGHCQRIL